MTELQKVITRGCWNIAFKNKPC